MWTLLSSQLFKSQRVSGNHMEQSVEEQIGTVSAVEAEAHLVQIGLQMLGAYLVPTSHDAALEQRECGLNSVRVNVGSEANILFPRVIHSLMFVTADSLLIGRKFIGHDHINIAADVLLDVPRQSSGLGILSVEKTQIAITLPNPDDHLFRVALTAPAASITALLSADIGFVHLDSTVQHRSINLFHGAADTVTEIPCGLVGAFVLAPKSTFELHSAHALLGFNNQQDGGKPSGQRQVGIVEDRSSCDREVILALGTVELFVSLNPSDTPTMASRTLDTVGPA